MKNESPFDWNMMKRQPDDKALKWLVILTPVVCCAGVIAAIVFGAWLDVHPYAVIGVCLALFIGSLYLQRKLEKHASK